jgi:hypothetical protein
MLKQIRADPTDETKRRRPCPSRLVDIATIARMKVATKKMNPKPKIQNVRNPRIRHIQPALTAEDFVEIGCASWAAPGLGSDWGNGLTARISASA